MLFAEVAKGGGALTLSARVLQDVAEHPDTNVYSIAKRLQANVGTVHRLVNQEFARVGLLTGTPPGAPGMGHGVPLRLTPRGDELLRLVWTLFGLPVGWRDDIAKPINGLDEAVVLRGQDSKVFDRADARQGPRDWVRMVTLDPEPPPLFPVLREASRNSPLIEAIATRKLRSIVLGAVLDRIKSRGGPLANFIS